MLVNILILVYLVCSYSFIFCVGCLYRVFLIVANSLVGLLILYAAMGFSWYLLLFVLVYVGGVYVLFIYVSLTLPNVGLVTYRFGDLFSGLNVSVLIFFSTLLAWVFFGSEVVEDFSVYLCSSSESCIYLFFCIVLLLGIVLVNFIMCSLSYNCVR